MGKYAERCKIYCSMSVASQTRNEFPAWSENKR